MFEDLYLYLSESMPVHYDGDDDPPTDPPTDPVDGDGDGDGDDRKFTQDELNKILAEDKRRHQSQYKKVEQQYQELLKKNNLSREERERLEENLEDVRKQLRTKEEQAKHEKKQLEDQYQQRIAELEQRAQTAETRYVDNLVTRSLQDAAVSGDAFSPSQVVTLLKPLVKMVDDKPMVDFPDVSSDTGEQIVTQMTPEEAVARMKQLPEMYGNLFKSNVVSGIGGASHTGGIPGNGQVDPRKLNMDQYIKLRRENPAALGLRPRK